MLKRIEFLTAEGYAPFTGRDLPQGGMLIDLLQAAMNLIKEQAKGAFDYQVSWVNDWSAHLNPLLITRALDAGIPWSKPDCSKPESLEKAGQYICQKFFFSDPLYESVTVLFVRNDGSLNFERDEQIVGKTLCRTKGWSTYELDKGGRNWVKEGKVTLLQPQTAQDCFRLLDEGTVDGVVIAELTGLAVAQTMSMSDRVHAAGRPLNIETMHVIIAKTHPSARTVLYYINSSLAQLRETGAYDAITAKHLEQFWSAAGATPSQPPTAGTRQPEAPPKPNLNPGSTGAESGTAGGGKSAGNRAATKTRRTRQKNPMIAKRPVGPQAGPFCGESGPQPTSAQDPRRSRGEGGFAATYSTFSAPIGASRSLMGGIMRLLLTILVLLASESLVGAAETKAPPKTLRLTLAGSLKNPLSQNLVDFKNAIEEDSVRGAAC